MLIERFLLPAASMTLASILNRVLCDHGGKFFTWVNEQTEDPQRLIERAAEHYAGNYTNRHGVIKVLGMRDPVPLESIYTAVQFLDRDGLRRFDSIDQLEKAFREGDRSFQTKTKQQNGLKVANDKQYLMLLGCPGAGKSTFLRRIGLEALKGEDGEYIHECIPVFLELKNLTAEVDLTQAIAQEFRICNFPAPERVTTKLLEAGSLLILLDGLDEVPTQHLDQAIQKIQNFVDQYDKNRFIASCRVAAYRHNFRRFSDVAMAEFNPGQIKEFITNWFNSDADREANTAQNCWALLQKPDYRAARELAQSPLLLTLLCLVYDSSQNFPQNRSVLYRKALRVLLEEWAAEKRIMTDAIYQGMSTELEEVLLSEIAARGFEANRLFFSQREVVEQIKFFLADNLNAPRHLNGEAVLDAIAIQQGILVERAQDVFSFSHLTLQEYLTAQYIDDHHGIQDLVTQHLSEERWQEVFLLVAGLMRGGADALLQAMAVEAQRLIHTAKLQALLGWADRITHAVLEPNPEDAVERAPSPARSSPAPAPPAQRPAPAAGTPGDRGLDPAAKRCAVLGLAVLNDSAIRLMHQLNPTLGNTLDLARTLANTRPLSAVLRPEQAHATLLTRSLAIALAQPLPARPMGQAIAKRLSHTVLEEMAQHQLFHPSRIQVLTLRLQQLHSQAPDIRQPAAAHQAFYHRVSQVWFTTLRLDPNWMSLSPEELQRLNQYFYATGLITACKQAAIRVSPQTWGAIAASLLTPVKPVARS
jgi:hypothetical protein